MCENHNFAFDVDQAYEDQLTAVLEASPIHPIELPLKHRGPLVSTCFTGTKKRFT